VLIPAAAWLVVWAAAAAVVDRELLLPGPALVFKTLLELVGTRLFWRSTFVSLLRIVCGAAAGVLLGCVLAVATSVSAAADLILSPAIRTIRATPVAGFIILVLLWVSTGAVPSVISCLMVMPVMWENVRAGIAGTDPLLLEMAESYDFGAYKTVRYVYLPQLKPHFSAGIRNAVGLAWKSGVAAEVLCLPKAAIGTQVYYSKIYLESASLFAWTAVVIVLSIVFEKLVLVVFSKKGAKG